MSTPHVVDDELVEALAEEFCARRGPTRSHGMGTYPCGVCALDARDFIGKHRLVRLPEEAEHKRRWGIIYSDGERLTSWDMEEDVRHIAALALNVTHIFPTDYYRIPGPPIEVSKEGGEP